MAKIDWAGDTKIANSLFSKLKVRLPHSAMRKIAYKDITINYLFESKNGCFCSACRRSFTLDTLDKHNTKRSCPKCRKQVIVQRNCGAKEISEHGNTIYAEDIEGYVVLRYFRYERTLFNHKDGNVQVVDKCTEVGRHVISDTINARFEKNWRTHNWERLNNSEYAGYYFSPSRDMWHWYPNFDCIVSSYAYAPSLKKVFDKYVNKFSFEFFNKSLADKKVNPYDTSFETKDEYGFLFESCLYNHLDTAIERFYKGGFKDLYLKNTLNRNKLKSILRKDINAPVHKMLGVSKEELKWVSTKDDYHYALDMIKKNKKDKLSFAILDLIYDIKGISNWDFIKEKTLKKVNYIKKQKITLYEYMHYLNLLKEVNFPMDNSNLYPKNFRQAEGRVQDIINIRIEKKRAKEDSKHNRLIKKISKALQTMPNLKEFMGGSDGLIVKVPESSEELRREGSLLHNCLGTYVGKVSNGNTLIFFIRRIDEPDTPFYAMELCDGEIRQLYTYNNGVDENLPKVKAFCTSLTEAIKKSNFSAKKVLKSA